MMFEEKKYERTKRNANHKISEIQHHTTSTHIIIAPFVVFIFGLYVDGKLRQKGALQGKRGDNEKSIGNVMTVI